MKILKFIFLLILLLFTACVSQKNSAYVNMYYNIERVNLGTLILQNTDTICKTIYDNNYNLPGKVCSALIDTNSILKGVRQAVYFNFGRKQLKIENGTWNKLPPQKDTAEFISNLKILLANTITGENILINDEVAGDSLLKNYKFRNGPRFYGPQKTGGRFSDGCCTKYLHFSSINSFVSAYNSGSIKEVDHYDFIFWLENDFLNNLSFKPDVIHIEVETTNKRTNMVKVIKNEHKLVSLN